MRKSALAGLLVVALVLGVAIMVSHKPRSPYTRHTRHSVFHLACGTSAPPPPRAAAALCPATERTALFPPGCTHFVPVRASRGVPHTPRDGETLQWSTLRDEHGKRSIPFAIHYPVHKDSFISASIQNSGTWDNYVLGVVEHVLRRVPPSERAAHLVVDVGAKLGYFAVTAAAFGFRTVAFEPALYNLDGLLATLARNPELAARATVFHMAVSNTERVVALAPTSPQNSGNFAMVNVTTMTEYGRDYVYAAPLDDILDEDVLLLKIDVETHESFVLDGARRLLCRRTVQHIILEAQPGSRACPLRPVLVWMRDIGYEVRDVVVGSKPLSDLAHGVLPLNVWLSRRSGNASVASCHGNDGAAAGKNHK